jgi:outer membrane murein-binding lipoprotein Lpp
MEQPSRADDEWSVRFNSQSLDEQVREIVAHIKALRQEVMSLRAEVRAREEDQSHVRGG